VYIRSLIHEARINPVGLNWRRFLLAVTPDGKVVGCAQIKPHYDGSSEFASLAVDPPHRGRGTARNLIEQLLKTSPHPIYLTCRSGLGPFYVRFGFRVADQNDLPPYFRRLKRLADIFLHGKHGEALLIMCRYDETSSLNTGSNTYLKLD